MASQPLAKSICELLNLDVLSYYAGIRMTWSIKVLFRNHLLFWLAVLSRYLVT